MRDRPTVRRDAPCDYHFRALLPHSQFRYAIVCPILCLMPDHIHLLWMGILEASDQRLATYIARNSERAGIVGLDGYADYPYSGCLVPGYPELKPFEPDFWTRFDRSISYLWRNGLVVGFGIPAEETGE